jgi:hypothetical protein
MRRISSQPSLWQATPTVLVLCCIAIVHTSRLFGGDGNDDPAVIQGLRQRLAKANPESIPLATRDDIYVSYTMLPAGSTTTMGATKSRGVGFVCNVSDHHVRIFLPAFVGPRLKGPGGEEVVVRLLPQFGVGDYIVLRPGEAYGRLIRPPMDGEGFVYLFYSEGHEGDSHFVTARVEAVKIDAVTPDPSK